MKKGNRRSIDEIADGLLDAQEEYRKAMRKHERAAYEARQKFLDAIIAVEDELKEGVTSWLDLDCGKYEFEWIDPGDLSVQLRTAIAERYRKGEGPPMCDACGVWIATCVGQFDGSCTPTYACDRCCDHEEHADGECAPIEIEVIS